jgi:hypothetical protein
MSKQSVEIVVNPAQNRVIRYKMDMVGNDLTATLRWCATHNEPLWVYKDKSYQCPYDRVVEVTNDNHVVVDPPWELV